MKEVEMKKSSVVCLIFILVCSMSCHSKKLTKSQSAVAEADGSGTEVKGIVGLNFKGLKHLVMLPRDTDQTLAGFAASGKLIASNVIYPTWLLPLSFTELKSQKLLVVQFSPDKNGASAEDYKVKTDSGLEVFKDCSGVVLFSMADGRSDCFDPDPAAPVDGISYDISSQEDWEENASTYATKTKRTLTGRTIEQVRRNADGTFVTTNISTTTSGEEYLGHAPYLIAYKKQEATDANPYAIPLFFIDIVNSENADIERDEIDASQIIAFSRSGIYYISKDRRKILFAVVTTGQPIIDSFVCDIKLDDVSKPFDQSGLINSGASDAGSVFLNTKGQILRIYSGRNLCLVANLKVDTNLVDGAIQGELFLYKEQNRGLTAQQSFNGVSISLVSDYTVAKFSINDDSHTVFFVGKDTTDQFVSGVFDAFGDTRKIEKFQIK